MEERLRASHSVQSNTGSRSPSCLELPSHGGERRKRWRREGFGMTRSRGGSPCSPWRGRKEVAMIQVGVRGRVLADSGSKWDLRGATSPFSRASRRGDPGASPGTTSARSPASRHGCAARAQGATLHGSSRARGTSDRDHYVLLAGCNGGSLPTAVRRVCGLFSLAAAHALPSTLRSVASGRHACRHRIGCP